MLFRSLDTEARAAWDEVRSGLEAAGFGVPRRSELDLHPEVVHALLRDGSLVAIGEFAYLPEQIEDLVDRVTAMPDGFTVGEFRDALGVSRKHAVPLAEWLDSRGITRREGDRRVIRRSRPGEPGPGDARSR